MLSALRTLKARILHCLGLPARAGPAQSYVPMLPSSLGPAAYRSKISIQTLAPIRPLQYAITSETIMEKIHFR